MLLFVAGFLLKPCYLLPKLLLSLSPLLERVSERAADVMAQQCPVKPEYFRMHPPHETPAGLRKCTVFIIGSERFGLFLFSCVAAHD